MAGGVKTSRLRRGESNSTSKVSLGVGLGVVVSPMGDSLTVSTYVDVLAVEKKFGEVSALVPEGFTAEGWGCPGVGGRHRLTGEISQSLQMASASVSR